MLSHGVQTCKTKRRSSYSTPESVDSNLSIMFAQEAAKYNQKTTLSSPSSLESKQRRPRSSSCELPYQAFQRRSRKVHFIDESDLSIRLVAKMPVLSPDVETKRRSSGSRSSFREASQRRSSRKAVHFTDIAIMPAQEAVKYDQETTHNSSSSLETKHSSSRSTSREAGRLPYRHRSSRTMHVTDKSDLSSMAQALDVAKYTQASTRMSSPDVQTKLRISRSTSLEAGQRRSSLKQPSPRSTSCEAESDENLYQRRGRSCSVHFDAYESDLSIMTRDVTKYTEGTTRMLSPGPALETNRRSSRSTCLEAGHHRKSREAVNFTGESDLSIMLPLQAVKYSQESTVTKPPPQQFLARYSKPLQGCQA